MISQVIRTPIRNRPVHSGILTLIILLLATPAADGEQQWNNATSGNWFTASNWTPAAVPNSTLDALINNGGEAIATAGGPITSLSIAAGKNGGQGALTSNGVDISVQQSLDVGDVEGTFATGNVNVTSNGTAMLTNMSSLLFGISGMGDVNAGQTSATGAAIAHGTGELTIDTVDIVEIAGDLDLGQTSGSGTATGHGNATIQTISTSFSVGGDLDVGQTSGTVGGMNQGTGMLMVDGVNEFIVDADVDVGQTTGDGQSTGMGTLNINDSNTTIGDSLDIAKVRALNSAVNSGTGHVSVNDRDLTIGFEALDPGSIEIGRVLTSETARGVGVGTLVLDQVDALVANDVIVGELALGGSNSGSSANGTLHLIDSRLDTRDLTVAARLDATAGSITGTLRLTRSLAIVQSVATFHANSTLEIEIHGTTRALGDGGADEYGALDPDMAVLGGALEINPDANYQGPNASGSIDTFELINSLFGISGNFAAVNYDGVSIGTAPTYLGAAGNGTDGLFVSVEQTATQFLLTNYLALPGDANGDTVVDEFDFNLWNVNKFTSGNDWTSGDFNGDGFTDGLDLFIWNANKFSSVGSPATVPEPATGLWAVYVLLGSFAVTRRHQGWQP